VEGGSRHLSDWDVVGPHSSLRRVLVCQPPATKLIGTCGGESPATCGSRGVPAVQYSHHGCCAQTKWHYIWRSVRCHGSGAGWTPRTSLPSYLPIPVHLGLADVTGKRAARTLEGIGIREAELEAVRLLVSESLHTEVEAWRIFEGSARLSLHVSDQRAATAAVRYPFQFFQCKSND